MANTILERIQEKYPGTTDDARNIAEAVAMAFDTGGRGAGSIVDNLYHDILVTFDPNGGTGTAFSVKYIEKASGYQIPECPFTPPEGKVFDYWYTNAAGGASASQQVRPGFFKTSFARDMLFYAIWKDAAEEPGGGSIVDPEGT